jgi:glycosyltransferase involved in cell wall biosynthesis
VTLPPALERLRIAGSSGEEASSAAPGFDRQEEKTVALLPWGNVIEDFLDSLDISIEQFCQEMDGGWLFGYVEALKRARCRSVIFAVSSRAVRLTTHRHVPTGAPIVVLPVSQAYRKLRSLIDDPYAWTVSRSGPGRAGRLRRIQAAMIRELALYACTPVRSLRRELRRHGTDAIVCQEYEYARFDLTVAIGRTLGIPVFATFQGGNWQITRIERLLRPWSLRLCSGLIIPARTEAERVLRHYGIGHDRIAGIFNPIDLSRWQRMPTGEARAVLGIPERAAVAVWHGRVDIRRKGLDVLLDAWDAVCASHTDGDFRLILVGTGVDAAAFRALLAERRPTGVQWIDEYVLDRDRMRVYLSAADVYAFPSRHEGFPLAPLEAMACGLPLVAADAPGVPDILARGEEDGGVMVPRGDVGAFAAALSALLDDPQRASDLGRRARRRVEQNFSLDAVGSQLRSYLFAPAGGTSGAADPGSSGLEPRAPLRP